MVMQVPTLGMHFAKYPELPRMDVPINTKLRDVVPPRKTHATMIQMQQNGQGIQLLNEQTSLSTMVTLHRSCHVHTRKMTDHQVLQPIN